MLDDLLELVLDVGGELLFSRKKGEQGKPEGHPWEYQVKKPPWEK